MAEPIGITGTAVGIVSLCLQIYGSLNNYIHDYKERDVYVGKLFLHLDRLREITRIVQLVIPAFQTEHYVPVQAVEVCLQDCEAELKSLDAAIRKYDAVPATDLKGKLKETRRKLGFPLARPEMEKLTSHLERVNNLLSLALRGLDLNVQNSNRNKLADLNNSTRTALVDLATIRSRLDEVYSKGVDLEARIDSDRVIVEGVSKDIRELSLITSEIRSSVPEINRIQTNTSSSVVLLRDLVANQQIRQQNTARLEARMEELKDIVMQAGQNSPGERFFRMLMSKPDFLRAWKDDLATLQSDSSNHAIESLHEPRFRSPRRQYHHTNVSCGCRFRQQITQRSSDWLVFRRFDETMVELYHEPWCPKFQNQITSWKYTVGAIYTGLHRILNIALKTSLTLTKGAGGYGISLVFRYYATVDGHKSPAFRIADLMLRGFICTIGEKPRSKEDYEEQEIAYQHVIHVGISKLQQIFTSRASLPTDYDQYGVTIFEAILSSRFGYPSRIGREVVRPTMGTLIQKSFDLDIPCVNNETGRQHQPAFIRYIKIAYFPHKKGLAKDDSSLALIPQLIQQLPEDYVWQAELRDLLNPGIRDCLAKIGGVYEILGLDYPLFTALLKQDEPLLRHIIAALKTSPSAFVHNGISAVHLAVFWPKGLRILLDSQPGLDINMECDGYTPLQIAVFSSGQLCTSPYEDKLCNDCPCAEAIEVLLNRRCRLGSLENYFNEEIAMGPRKSSPSFGGFSFVAWINSGSTKAIHVILNHMRLWRERLFELAGSELSETDKQQLGLKASSILDHTAFDVIQMLESKGIFPCEYFQLEPNDHRLAPPSSPQGSLSVYHSIDSPHAAEIAFQLGFKDIDTPYMGKTPIMYEKFDKGYVDWLLSHGACATRLMPLAISRSSDPVYINCPRRLIAHFLISAFGRLIPVEDYKLEYLAALSRRPSLRKLAYLQTKDGCECGCSVSREGCIPIAIFLRSTPAKECYQGPKSTYVLLNNICSLIGVFEMDGNLPLVIAEATIRWITFRELGIRHTCCKTIKDWNKENFDCYGEDFAHIREEDESLLVELEELVTEFQEEFDSQGQPLADFIRGYWVQRMDEVRREKEARRLTREEIEGAERLGVKLVEHGPEKPPSPPSSPLKKDEKTAEYWIREMNKIFP